LKKIESIERCSFIGVGIVSVVFHRFERVVPIIDGLFLASSPSSMSASSKTSSLLLSTLTIKKRLILDSPQAKKKAYCMDILKNQEPKLAAYKVDWFNSTSTKNRCLKHTSKNNLPVTQKEQISFLLNKYQTSDIKTAFADAVGSAQPREFFSTHILIIKISSFVVFLS
jgi:hypothetical protein